ncbi:MAG TPA: Holliday junction resolvase RuvX, partial [Chitinophagales bacterium]|nr:Holliday junction resolvase RuvX [Chitinophagales bacterium]
MGKILALDYGKKRTGIALSDDMRIFAFGHSTADTKNLQSVLQNLVTQEKVSTIILGEPKRLNNEVSSTTEMVYQFQKNLESWFPEMEIVLVDERYTSKMAQ